MSAKIFYSYSHKDELFREKLEMHLSILKRSGIIEEWYDRRIAPGSNWEESINENIERSNIILLLVSSNFLASDYCYDTETVRALDMHSNKEAIVIPIILQPCLWKISNFAQEKIQVLPKDAKPITCYNNQDEAWQEIVEGIMLIANKINLELKEATENRTSTLNISKVKRIEHEILKEELVKKFLCKYSNWYFSPLRISSWGSKQYGFEDLKNLKSSEVSVILINLLKRGVTKTKISQKGNPIYKIVNSYCLK